jgi:hypothetical protein
MQKQETVCHLTAFGGEKMEQTIMSYIVNHISEFFVIGGYLVTIGVFNALRWNGYDGLRDEDKPPYLWIIGVVIGIYIWSAVCTAAEYPADGYVVPEKPEVIRIVIGGLMIGAGLCLGAVSLIKLTEQGKEWSDEEQMWIRTDKDAKWYQRSPAKGNILITIAWALMFLGLKVTTPYVFFAEISIDIDISTPGFFNNVYGKQLLYMLPICVIMLGFLYIKIVRYNLIADPEERITLLVVLKKIGSVFLLFFGMALPFIFMYLVIMLVVYYL